MSSSSLRRNKTTAAPLSTGQRGSLYFDLSEKAAALPVICLRDKRRSIAAMHTGARSAAY